MCFPATRKNPLMTQTLRLRIIWSESASDVPYVCFRRLKMQSLNFSDQRFCLNLIIYRARLRPCCFLLLFWRKKYHFKSLPCGIFSSFEVSVRENLAIVVGLTRGSWPDLVNLHKSGFHKLRPDFYLLPSIPLRLCFFFFSAQGWPSTLLVVSHDRNFLDEVPTDMLHLHSQKIDSYRCEREIERH